MTSTPKRKSSGQMLEDLVVPYLQRVPELYSFDTKKYVCCKPNGRKMVTDIIAVDRTKPGAILISAKWQEVGGTAEEKIAYEICMLLHAIERRTEATALVGYPIRKAYLVLGGSDRNLDQGTDGWTIRQWLIEGGLKPWIKYDGLVELIRPDDLCGRISRGKL
jgi:hypothetical protein